MTRLSESTALNTPLIRLSPAAPHFFMVPKNLSAEEEYQGAWSTRDVFMTFGKGVKTERDKVSIHFSEKAIRNTVADFQTMDDASLRDKYALPRDSRDWKVLSAKDDVLKNDGDERYIRILYRPFDLRHTWYSGKTRGFIGTPGFPAMRHMLRPNLAMLLTRQVTSPPYNHCFVTRDPSEIKCASHDRASDVVPLFLYDDAALANETHGRPNFTREFLAALAKALGLPSADDSGLPEGITPYDVFFYSYSVFHSPCYRFRYAELLRLDFPRLPLPSGVAVFRALANLGAELVSVHLLESSAVTSAELKRVETLPIAVEAVSYSDGTVWIDRTKTIGFPGVSEDVWNFRIGGYQICNKWLKDRQAKGGKNPRPAHLLTDDDIAHYQKIIVAIGETIRIMAEIDEAIEAHGGWPSAFATDLAASEEESQQFALVAEPEQSYGD